MARVCKITGKKPMSGNNVSHAQNKTKRRFMPNLQEIRLFSESLGRYVKIRLSVKGLRTVEHKGGLDAFLLGTPNSKLENDMKKLKAQVVTASEAKKAS